MRDICDISPFSIIDRIGVGEDQMISECLMKELFVMDDIQMSIEKFRLDGSMISFYVSIDLRASGITKEMGYTIKLCQVLRSYPAAKP